jgi:hypothetical protein
MNPETKMIALDVSSPDQSNLKTPPKSGLLSERSAIVICSLGVAVFAIPVLVVIQILSSFYWGGFTLYQLLNSSEFNDIDNI